MEPYKAKELPHEYTMTKELLKLLCSARESYGEYKGYLKNMKYDYTYFLETMFINDLYYSFKIDNSKISKEDMFMTQHMIKNNEVVIFNNMKKSLLLAVSLFSKNGFSIEGYNRINKSMYLGCKKDNTTKGSGSLRKKQTFMLKPGLAGSVVSFIPPVYTEINGLLKNICDYINTTEDDPYISIALTHFQFEKVHPYVSGNGKLGRLMMPIQYSYYQKEPPLLFISEAIDNLRNTYFTLLSGEEEKEPNVFIKFILECIINQCNLNIKKIKKLNKVYETDYESFKEIIGGSTIYKVYPSILKRVVFTTNDIIQDTKLHINSVNKVLNKLVSQGYLVKEKKNSSNRVTFTYTNLYNVFIK